MTEIQEAKSAAEAVAVAFEHYKATNDERLSALERKDGVDVLVTDKLRRLDGEINRLQQVISSVKTAAARPASARSTTWQAPEVNEHKQAFMRYMAKGMEGDLAQLQTKNFVGSDPEGGFMVPGEIAERIATRQFDTTPMRQLATVLTTSSDALEILRDAVDAEALWVSETETRTDTDGGAFGKIRIVTHELHAQPRASQRLLDDATINVEEYLINKIADRFARAENAAFINGTGVDQPRGLATYGVATTADATRPWGTFEYVPTGSAGAFPASNAGDVIISLIYRLKAGYHNGAAFIMPRAVADDIRKMKDGGSSGGYLWQPSLAIGQPATLLGYPVFLAEDMPGKANNSLSLAFGNFKEAYTIVDRMDLRVFRDPYTAAPFVKFRCNKRVGGDVTNFEAIKFLRFSAS